jgi:hypothetical protein
LAIDLVFVVPILVGEDWTTAGWCVACMALMGLVLVYANIPRGACALVAFPNAAHVADGRL